jgi:hypothetical protein
MVIILEFKLIANFEKDEDCAYLSQTKKYKLHIH